MPLVHVAPLPSPGGPCAVPIGALATCARYLPPMVGYFPPPYELQAVATAADVIDGGLASYHWPDVSPPRPYTGHSPSHGWIRECAEIQARRSARFDRGAREGLDP